MKIKFTAKFDLYCSPNGGIDIESERELRN